MKNTVKSQEWPNGASNTTLEAKKKLYVRVTTKYSYFLSTVYICTEIFVRDLSTDRSADHRSMTEICIEI